MRLKKPVLKDNNVRYIQKSLPIFPKFSMRNSALLTLNKFGGNAVLNAAIMIGREPTTTTHSNSNSEFESNGNAQKHFNAYSNRREMFISVSSLTLGKIGITESKSPSFSKGDENVPRFFLS